MMMRIPEVHEIKGFCKHGKIVVGSPKLVGRILNGYFKARILGKPVLRSVELALTFKCQAKCGFCYSSRLQNDSRKVLSVDEIKDVWAQCRELGAIHVNLTGGEPLMRPEWCEIIEALDPRSTIVSMVTNGYMLNEESVALAKRAGLRYLQVSLDSVSAEEHDRSRGIAGLFDRALAGIECARKAGITVSLSAIVTNENAKNGEIEKIVRLAEDKKIFLLLNLAAMAGRWQDNRSVVLDEQARRKVSSLRRSPYVRQNTMYNFRMKEGCPAALEKIYITAYGDVTPCALTHISYGDLRSKSLADILEKMRKVQPYSDKPKECLRCENSNYFQKMIAPLADFAEAGCQMPVTIDNHPYFKR